MALTRSSSVSTGVRIRPASWRPRRRSAPGPARPLILAAAIVTVLAAAVFAPQHPYTQDLASRLLPPGSRGAQGCTGLVPMGRGATL